MATNRQLIAVKKLSEILRKAKGQKNVTMGKILKEAGYSDSVSKHPDIVTETKGFKELLEEYLPDALIQQTHKDLLQAARLDEYKMDANLDDKEIQSIVESVPGCKVRKILRFKKDLYVTVYFWAPDGQSRKAAIDMAYKLKGSYAPEKSKIDLGGQLEVVRIKNYGGNGSKKVD